MNKPIALIVLAITLLLAIPCVAQCLGDCVPHISPLQVILDVLRGEWPEFLVGLGCGMVISALLSAIVHRQRPVLYWLLPFGLVLLGISIFCIKNGLATQPIGIGGF